MTRKANEVKENVIILTYCKSLHLIEPKHLRIQGLHLGFLTEQVKAQPT